MSGDAYISTTKDSSSYPSTTTLAASPSRPIKLVEDSMDTEDEDEEEDQYTSATAAPSFPTTVGAGAKPGRIIGNSHPLHDFKANLSRGDVVSKAVADMGAVIPEIVAESFSSQRFDEALDCMKAMRDTALKVSLHCSSFACRCTICFANFILA